MEATQNTASALEQARIKARQALDHLNACRLKVNDLFKRTVDARFSHSVASALWINAVKKENIAQERYIDAHAALYEAQQDAGMSDREIELDRQWVTAGHLAREAEPEKKACTCDWCTSGFDCRYSKDSDPEMI